MPCRVDIDRISLVPRLLAPSIDSHRLRSSERVVRSLCSLNGSGLPATLHTSMQRCHRTDPETSSPANTSIDREPVEKERIRRVVPHVRSSLEVRSVGSDTTMGRSCPGFQDRRCCCVPVGSRVGSRLGWPTFDTRSLAWRWDFWVGSKQTSFIQLSSR